MAFLLKAVEQHHYIAIVKDEEYTVDITVVFCSQLKQSVFDELDEFLT